MKIIASLFILISLGVAVGMRSPQSPINVAGSSSSTSKSPYYVWQTPEGSRGMVIRTRRDANSSSCIQMSDKDRAALEADGNNFKQMMQDLLKGMKGNAETGLALQERDADDVDDVDAVDAGEVAGEVAGVKDYLHAQWSEHRIIDVESRVLNKLNHAISVDRQEMRNAKIKSPKGIDGYHALSYDYIAYVLCNPATQVYHQAKKITCVLAAELQKNYGKSEGWVPGKFVIMFGQKRDAEAATEKRETENPDGWYVYHAAFQPDRDGERRRSCGRPPVTDKDEYVNLRLEINAENRLCLEVVPKAPASGPAQAVPGHKSARKSFGGFEEEVTE